jgi:hypothetical protein
MTGNNNIHTKPVRYLVWFSDEPEDAGEIIEAHSAMAARREYAKRYNLDVTKTVAQYKAD